MRFFVGITGASGHAYAQGLLRALADSDCDVDLSITGAGAKVLKHELGVVLDGEGEGLSRQLADWLGERAASYRLFPVDQIEAPPASGTALRGGAIICPCSMGTLARISVGYSSNLVERAADVALKEGLPLTLVPRETPLSAIHLENMLRLARLGACLVPAMPGFYHRPSTIDDLVEHVVGKVLDRVGVEHRVSKRWKGLPEPEQDPGTGVVPPTDPLGSEMGG